MVDFFGSSDRHCEGFFASGKKNYLLGIYFATAKKKRLFSRAGSGVLDEINVFDSAEVAKANLGQINLINVSSFCGPRGFIWGYDLCRADKTPHPINKSSGAGFSVYRIEPLADAFIELVGTIDAPRFPFLPGSHVPCASRHYVKAGRGRIYVAVAIGIPADRKKCACVIMEDVGDIPDSISKRCHGELASGNMVKSVMEIGKNQKIRYREVFVGVESISFDRGEIGCALVASPYFLLAQDADPGKPDLFDLDLKRWRDIISKKNIWGK